MIKCVEKDSKGFVSTVLLYKKKDKNHINPEVKSFNTKI